MPLEGETLSYVKLIFFPHIHRPALNVTGACANALPQKVYDELRSNNPKLFKNETPSFTSVRMASVQRVSVDNQVNLTFGVGIHSFTDSFLVLPQMNSVFLGNLFLKKQNITINLKNNLLKLPDFTVQLNEMKPDAGKKRQFVKK